MTDASYAVLEDRGLIALAGPDTLALLQGVVTNDVMPAAEGRAVYAALLTPQGKYLHDFIVVPLDGVFYLDCERSRLDDLKRRITLYRLRAKVTIENASDRLIVAALFGNDAAGRIGLAAEPGRTAAFGGGTAYRDPRLDRLGARAILSRTTGLATLDSAGLHPAIAADYHRLRMGLGIAEGGSEIGAERTLALEAGLDALNGVSFSKGCYVGQEVTSRMKTRRLVKKRIVPVGIDGPPPAPGATIRLGEAEAGEIRAIADGVALALMRLDALDKSTREGLALTSGETTLLPRPAEWLDLP